MRHFSPTRRQAALENIRTKHDQAIEKLRLPQEDSDRIKAVVDSDLSDIKVLLKAVGAVRIYGTGKTAHKLHKQVHLLAAIDIKAKDLAIARAVHIFLAGTRGKIH